MTYASLHRVDERSQLAFLGLLVLLFVVAWAFVFLHAWVTIALFWLGLIALGINTIAHRAIRRAAAKEARRSLEAHACPLCAAGVERNAEGEWQCLECGASFLSTGSQTGDALEA